MKRYASLALGATVAVAALVPLYGDIRSISHPEWARMLVRALHASEIVDSTTQASQVFAILSWRENVSYRADRYYRAEKISVDTRGKEPCVTGDGATGEVAFRVAIARAGHYRVRARLQGSPSAGVVAQLATLRDGEPVATYDVVPAPVLGWTDARVRPGAWRRLAPGGYVASFLVPPGACLAQVELVPPCLQPIEPLGGWKPRAVTQTSDVAVTILKALDLEWELPPAATAVERAGSDFEVDDSAGQGLAIQAAAGPEMTWLRGAAGGTRALLVVNLPDNGLYTFSVLGRFATAQRWGLDSCFETLLCPSPSDKEGLRWRAISTMEMMAGRHMLSVELPPGGVIARVKLERKKATAEDYRATLQRLGLDVGAEAPVTRRGASDAVGFLKSRAQSRENGQCRDIEFSFPPSPGDAGVRAGDQTALLQPVQAPPAAPPQPPGGLPPIAPPAVDPGNRQPPATPEPEPPVSSPPIANATPPTPTPATPTPPPPTPTPPTPTPPTPTPPTPVPTQLCGSPPAPCP